MSTQPHEIVIQVDGTLETIGMRNPKDIPNDIPGNDACFMNRELRGAYEIGKQGHRWCVQEFLLHSSSVAPTQSSCFGISGASCG